MKKDIYKFWSKKRLKEEIRFLKVVYNQLFDSYKSSSDFCSDKIEKLEKENEQLKQKIERMKNHENCKHHSQYSRMHTFYADDKIICYKCKNCSLWELAE